MRLSLVFAASASPVKRTLGGLLHASARGAAGWADVGRLFTAGRRMLTLPIKMNQDRLRHMRQQKHKVTNSARYVASLRQRAARRCGSG